MSVIKKDKFDVMLSGALQEHSETVPADFTDRISRKIREAEERKILARVILEERLALTGCIALSIIAIVAVVFFPGIAVGFKELVETSIYKATQALETIRYGWHIYVVFAGVFGFAVYSLMDLLVGDSWQ
jgi:hypothetical protein